MAQRVLRMMTLAAALTFAPAVLATVPIAAAPAGPAAAAASDAHATGHDNGAAHGAQRDLITEELKIGPFIITILVFLSLFLVLSRTAWKPILTSLKNREEAIRDSIEAAARARAEAEQTTRTLEARMAEAQRQSAAALQQTRADALKVAETIRTQAEAESAALKDRTLREIDAAKQQAVADINGYAAELGIAVARRILQRQITADDQQRLVNESLAELAQKN